MADQDMLLTLALLHQKNNHVQRKSVTHTLVGVLWGALSIYIYNYIYIYVHVHVILNDHVILAF